MSKSIYDEALNLIENIGRNLPYTWLVGRDNLMKIKQTLEQAQKQEKLLELYRKLMTVKDELISLAWFDAPREEMEEKEAYLEQQIKELENE